MRLSVALMAVVAAAACKQRPVFHDAPPRAAAGVLRGTYALTYYWLPTEVDQPTAPANTIIYDRTCQPLARVSVAFASELATSGAGKLVDDRMITVDGECNCKRSPCFRIALQPWGVGAGNRPLVPFRSLAVDRNLIPIGTALWIEQLDGIDIPGTFPTLHDGCVVADDIGGRITGERIDWFVGRQPYYLELDKLLHLSQVTVFDGGDRCH